MNLLKKLLFVVIILPFIAGCFGHEEGRYQGPQQLPTQLPEGTQPGVEAPVAPPEETGGGILRRTWDGIVERIGVEIPKWRGARMYGGAGVDNANAIAVNNNGVVYIAGNSDEKVLLLAYSPDGDLLWDKKEFVGVGKSVVLDDAGNIYVVGDTSENLGSVNPTCVYKGGRDLFVVKYKPDGSFDWVCQFGTDSNEFAHAAVTDPGSRNMIYMVSSSGAIPDALVLSFSVDTQHWIPIESFSTPNADILTSIAMLGDIYIYVAGVTTGCLDETFVPCSNETKTDADIFFARIDKNRSLETLKKQFGTPENDSAPAIGVGARAELYNYFIAGVTEGSFDGIENDKTDWFVRRYDQDAETEIWTNQFHTPKYDDVNGLIMYFDGSEDTIIVFGDTNCGALSRDTCDILVVKYDLGGNQKWVERLGTEFHKEDVARAAAMSPDKKIIYVVGNTFGDMDTYENQGSPDIFVIKLRASDGVKL